MLRSVSVAILVSIGIMGGLPNSAIALSAMQTPPPADPGPVGDVPEVPPALTLDPKSPYPSPYSDCGPALCTIIDWLNSNIPADREVCIAVDSDGRDMRGRKHYGDTCRPVDSVDQRGVQRNP